MKMQLISNARLKEVLAEIMEERIIQSVIGDDFYKNTMGAFIHHNGYNNIHTGWKVTNRTKNVHLSNYLNENDIQKELAHFRGLSLLEKEERFLKSIPHYGDKLGTAGYIDFLKNSSIPEIPVNLSGEQPDITWNDALWINSSRVEIPMLQILIGLFYRNILSQKTQEECMNILRDGVKKLEEDIALLKANPDTKIIIFANRRVLLPWLREITKVLMEEVPDQILGISNVQLAMEFGIPASGTIAHEPHMVFAALAFDGTEESIKNSQIKLITEWVDYYGTEMSVLLPDTYRTENMIRWLPKELVARYRAGRIDSKDPLVGIPEILNWFAACGCAPFIKAAIPSDGISINDAVNFQKQFGNRGSIVNAPGTLLGCNLDLPKISLVAKVSTANGIPCVKLSDNSGKPTGDPIEAERYNKALPSFKDYFHEQVV